MKVLVSAEDPGLRIRLIEAFRKRSYTVDAVDNGTDALQRLQDRSFDLAIVSARLPGMNGFEVVRQLRLTRQTPVILIVPGNASSERIRGLTLGADDCLSRSFEFDELLARAHSLLRRAKGTPMRKIKIQEVEIDATAGRIYRNREEVSLTNREYAITLALSMRAGQIVTPKDLAGTLASEHGERLLNSLNVHIFSIRQKLGKAFIKTVRGRGFIVDH